MTTGYNKIHTASVHFDSRHHWLCYQECGDIDPQETFSCSHLKDNCVEGGHLSLTEKMPTHMKQLIYI